MVELGLDLGPHAAFIWAAYAAVAGALSGLTIWIAADERRQRRLIAELEAQGVARRSAKPAEPTPALQKAAGKASGKAPAKSAALAKTPAKAARKPKRRAAAAKIPKTAKAAAGQPREQGPGDKAGR